MSETIYYLDILGLFLSAVSMAGLSAYIYFKNRKSLINRVFSLLLFLLSLSVLVTLIKAIINVAAWVIFCNRFVVSIYSLIDATLLYFCLIFPEEKNLPKRLIVALYLPAVFFALAAVLTNGIVIGLQPSNVKHLYLSEEIYGPLLKYYSFYTFIYVVVGSISLIIYKLLKSSGVQRKKLLIFLFAIVFGAINLFVFTLILRLLGIVRFDTLGQMSLFISAILMTYSIMRFKLFAISPKVAAEEILISLEKSILVSDPFGNILFQGKMQPQPNPQQLQKIVNTTLDEGDLKRYLVMIEGRPFNVSTSTFPQGGGVVILFDDITEIEEEEAREKKAHDQLVEVLAKDRALRKSLTEVTTSVIFDESLKSLRNLLARYPDTTQVLEHMTSLQRKRLQLLEDLKKDKEKLEKNYGQIKDINQQLIKRELQMVELKNKIQNLIESNKNQAEREKRIREYEDLMKKIIDGRPPTDNLNS